MRRFFPIVLFLCLQSVWVAAGSLCSPLSYEGNAYSVCRVDLRETRLETFNLDGKGAPLGSFTALAESLSAEGKELGFAMNAGMFDEGLKPIGLYIEAGTQAKKLNRRDGYGNFHVKPNGVFYITGDRVGVATTDTYVKLNEKPDFATQSGPMLVIEGKIHPKFSPGGISYKMRNGVGVLDAHTAIFVISENAVNFYDFAMLFRDGLKCANALFFDGTVSSLYSPELGRNDGFAALGPMVGAVKVK
ncbi:MAG: phosphodiester glycosidase family protein [Aestuariivirga sp.]|nr:phosphodiester glycosidase family protein [Aestuariivirga sp.]